MRNIQGNGVFAISSACHRRRRIAASLVDPAWGASNRRRRPFQNLCNQSLQQLRRHGWHRKSL